MLAIGAWHFPYSTDDPIRREDALKSFYDLAYSETGGSVLQDTEMARESKNNKFKYNIKGRIESFVKHFKLEQASVLDVGSGTGYLQDVVDKYTGIDISNSAKRFYRKRFVAGTATAMPFADNEFDVAWSIWVLEHIPNPEAALSEIRRVVRSGGLLYLAPAWDCKPWAAQGYEARPYSDLSLGGKLIKSSIPVRRSYPFWFAATVPGRIARSFVVGPTRFHYRRLEPNYREFWQPDSDAVNSLDMIEMARWFESRGDECLSCFKGPARVFQNNGALIVLVRK